jgi:hypothetical protein
MSMVFVHIKNVFFYCRIKINCKFAIDELDA